jgi:transcriptional regulator of acetoin/glycerol metabolism
MMIIETLRMNEGNREQTAKELGISRQGLYKKMQRYGIS